MRCLRKEDDLSNPVSRRNLPNALNVRKGGARSCRSRPNTVERGRGRSSIPIVACANTVGPSSYQKAWGRRF